MGEDLLPVGAEAPDFSAETTGGQHISLADFRGREAVLLMFYPMDDTPGCTKQMCTARDEGADYRAAGVARFGVNPGSADSHESFVEKYTLDFPLIVDEGSRIAAAYGVKGLLGVHRATYLIDRDGRIAFSGKGAHGAAEVLEALRG